MPNLANQILRAAYAVNLNYMDYIRKYPQVSSNGRLVICERIDTAALLEEEHRIKEEKRKLKYNK